MGRAPFGMQSLRAPWGGHVPREKTSPLRTLPWVCSEDLPDLGLAAEASSWESLFFFLNCGHSIKFTI